MSTLTNQHPGARPQIARRRPSRLALGGTLAASAALSVGYLLTHDPHVAGRYPTCVLLELTGWACPACGGTRAAFDLAHGDVAHAFSHNPLVPLGLMAALLVVGYRWVVRRSGRQLASMPAWVPVAIGVGVLVFGVVRNLPGWEFLGPA